MPELKPPELLPCPFLHPIVKGLDHPRECDSNEGKYVYCLDCNTAGPTGTTVGQAVMFWNTRTQPKEETPCPSPPSESTGPCPNCGIPIELHTLARVCPVRLETHPETIDP